MRFEKCPETPGWGLITLEGNERTILNLALHDSLHRAATVGDQMEVGSPIEKLCRIGLHPANLTVKKLTINDEQLEAASSAITIASRNTPNDQIREVGGFIAQLDVASDILKQDVIDEIVRKTVIPGTLAGFDF